MIKNRMIARHMHVPGLTIDSRLLHISVTIFLLLICGTVALAQENASQETDALSETPTKEDASPAAGKQSKSQIPAEDKPFSFTPHRPNYFLAVTYNDNPNEEVYPDVGREVPNNYEADFQLSIKVLILKDLFKGRGKLFFAYTQRSWWQIYNTSAPFRETNYEPEVFLRFNTDFPDLPWLGNKYFLLGFAHQSNGQGEDLSRSWNRLYIEFIAKTDKYMLGLKPWYRVPESAETDDNPDIDRYLGYGELYGAYKFSNLICSFLFRNNVRFDENRSGIELGLSYTLRNNLRLYLQYYNGYGESLIDYNNFTNRIGFGFIINDWL
jgi:phospholipase A1